MDSSETSAEDAAISDIQKRVDEKLEKLNPTETKQTEIVTSDGAVDQGFKGARGEVSAAAIARMMGLATTSEVTMLEGKVDLLSSRVANMTTKIERLNNTLSHLPTGSDLDRIDINIGSLKTMIRDVLQKLVADSGLSPENTTGEGAPGVLKKSKIMSNSEPTE
jgi:hypothetical protein